MLPPIDFCYVRKPWPYMAVSQFCSTWKYKSFFILSRFQQTLKDFLESRVCGALKLKSYFNKNYSLYTPGILKSCLTKDKFNLKILVAVHVATEWDIVFTSGYRLRGHDTHCQGNWITSSRNSVVVGFWDSEIVILGPQSTCITLEITLVITLTTLMTFHTEDADMRKAVNRANLVRGHYPEKCGHFL